MVCESAKWRSRRLKLTLFTYIPINAEIPPATGKYRLVCPKQDPGTNRFLCWIPRVFLTAATYFFANVKKHNSWKIMVTNNISTWNQEKNWRYFFCNIFENFDFWIVIISRIAHTMTTINEVGARSYKYTGRSNAALVCIMKWFTGFCPTVEGYGRFLSSWRVMEFSIPFHRPNACEPFL